MRIQKGVKTYMNMPVSVKNIDKENFTLTMVASTQDADRHGDVVMQKGWILDAFLKNPVILNSHNYDDATEVIAKATRTEIMGKGKKARLEQDWKFAVNENPKAKIIFDLYAGGFLNASSVGFIPKAFKQDKDGTIDWFTITEAELLEVSAVSVPANAMALAKAKGIDVPVELMSKDTTPEASDDGIVDDEPEPEPEEPETQEDEKSVTPVVKKSYNAKVYDAIRRIETREQKILKQVINIMQKLLDGDIEGARMEKKTREKIRKRKINKAIRSLFTLK